MVSVPSVEELDDIPRWWQYRLNDPKRKDKKILVFWCFKGFRFLGSWEILCQLRIWCVSLEASGNVDHLLERWILSSWWRKMRIWTCGDALCFECSLLLFMLAFWRFWISRFLRFWFEGAFKCSFRNVWYGDGCCLVCIQYWNWVLNTWWRNWVKWVVFHAHPIPFSLSCGCLWDFQFVVC